MSKDTEKTRSPRRKTYERQETLTLPSELQAHFKKDCYDLKLIRWALQGEEDYMYLHSREKEGYEFVKKEEIPAQFLGLMREIDTKARPGLLTLGDLCLMKIDSDLRASREKYFEDLTKKQLASVDVNVLEKKGFRNLGTRSRVIQGREPGFKE